MERGRRKFLHPGRADDPGGLPRAAYTRFSAMPRHRPREQPLTDNALATAIGASSHAMAVAVSLAFLSVDIVVSALAIGAAPTCS